MILTEDFPAWFVRIGAFLFGSLWGSFFNVAIYRWPRGLSVVHPPSHCTTCGAPIPPWRNVPIFGWLVLRGKTACCGAKLSPRYVVVELIGGVLCAGCFERLFVQAPGVTEATPAALEALAYFLFAGGLTVATFVDLERMEIPDEVSLPGAAFGLATAGLRHQPGAESAALGAGGAFLIVQLLFVWTYERFTGRRGMGEGDAKLLLMIGAFIGWQGAIFALVAGAAQGLVVALVAILSGRTASLSPSSAGDDEEEEEDDSAEESEEPVVSGAEVKPVEAVAPAAPARTPLKMPFGPFLALGALEFFYFGDFLLDWYYALYDV